MAEKAETEKRDARLAACMTAVLFVHADAVRVERLARACGATSDDVRRVARQAAPTDDATQGLCMLLHEDAVRLVTAPAHRDAVDAMLARERDEALSPAALEVLAIVAYRSPVSRAEVDAIRGVNCGAMLRKLLLRGLIERVRDAENSRVYRYRVTEDFLAHLGIRDVDELPDYAALAAHEKIAQVTQGTA